MMGEMGQNGIFTNNPIFIQASFMNQINRFIVYTVCMYK